MHRSANTTVFYNLFSELRQEQAQARLVSGLSSLKRCRCLDGLACNRFISLAGLRIPRDADQRSELMSITIPK